MGRDR